MANTDVTLTDMEILSHQERASTGFTHKITIDYTDINEGSGNADTVTVTIANTPTKFAVLRCLVNVTTVFDGASSQELRIEVGTDGDPNNFIASNEILDAAVTGPVGTAGAIPATLAGSVGNASDVVEVLFTNAAAGSPSALTQGSLDLWLELSDLA